MPAGLDKQLTPQKLADLVEFLTTRKQVATGAIEMLEWLRSNPQSAFVWADMKVSRDA
jgi:hypothetical protein